MRTLKDCSAQLGFTDSVQGRPSFADEYLVVQIYLLLTINNSVDVDALEINITSSKLGLANDLRRKIKRSPNVDIDLITGCSVHRS